MIQEVIGMNNYLTDRRKELGLTMKEVACAVGVSEATVSRWESGAIANMRRDKIAKYAAILKVTPTFIMTGISENNSDYDSLPEGAIPYTPEPMVNIPLVGSVSCGMPLFAEDNIEGYISTPESSLTSGEAYFWLHAKGDSMINAGIQEGDLLLIRRQDDVDNGDIAVVAINGDEATLKRVLKKENAIILQPENPAYEMKIFVGKEMENIHIRGRLMELRKSF